MVLRRIFELKREEVRQYRQNYFKSSESTQIKMSEACTTLKRDENILSKNFRWKISEGNKF
jgi:hypothetical protein